MILTSSIKIERILFLFLQEICSRGPDTAINEPGLFHEPETRLDKNSRNTPTLTLLQTLQLPDWQVGIQYQMDFHRLMFQ